jgi:serine/threonine-protein kinase
MKGKLLGNRYELLECIGSGGMAEVYRAKCHLLNRQVAVKILKSELMKDDEFVQKFKIEAQASAGLNHPNIVNVFDVGADQGMYYIVMELIEGKTLQEVIRERKRLSPEKAVRVFAQIASAVEFAHDRHIIHRDLKPQNIMVNHLGNIKVMDFGIARATTSETLQVSDKVLGSVAYLSPEQAKGVYSDERSDLYSLGIVFYEMLTGRTPFKGETPISVVMKHLEEELSFKEKDDVPIGYQNIIRKLTQKLPENRYQSVRELVADLKKAKAEPESEAIAVQSFSDSPTTEVDVEGVKERVRKMTEDGSSMQQKRQQPKKKTKKKKVSSLQKWSISGAAVILAFLLVLFAAYQLSMNNIVNISEVEVPNMQGLTLTQAQALIEDIGIELYVEKEIYSNSYDKGVIVEQGISAGRKIKRSPVGVTLSKGAKLVEVPDIVNNYAYSIDVLLSGSGLIKGSLVYEFSDEPDGIIIRQEPSAGEMVAEGTPVNYIVSSGVEKEYRAMPSIIGLQLEEATQQLEDLGFAIGQIIYENSEQPAGEILYQSYPEGSDVVRGSEISVKVSKESADSDPKEVSKTITLRLPQTNPTVKVKLTLVSPGGEIIVYEEVLSTEQGNAAIALKGTGQQTYKIYYDDQYLIDYNVTFSGTGQ